MFYYLFSYLDSAFDMPGAGVFSYISFRAVMSFITALFVSIYFGKRFIYYLQRKQIGEEIRDLDLEGQKAKKGTPTMGGIIILLAILVPVLLFSVLHNIYIVLMIITTIWLGGLGFIDDYIKVFRHNKEGLHGKFKIIAQVGVGLIVGLVLYFSPDVIIYGEGKSTATTIPFFKFSDFDYADLFAWAGEYAHSLGWIFFVFVTIFVVTAVSNGANLTDGLDGLATGSSAIQGVVLCILAYFSGNIKYADYLDIMYIPGSGELVVFAAAFIGATIGFLWFNANPAQVFMGDTGSLALGGIIAVFAIIIHKELLLPILSGIFLVESLSVIMQTSYFKFTKKKYGEGRRIFKMAPLHHHFQKVGVPAVFTKPVNGIPENKITMRFWIVGLLLAAFTLITLKLR